jgi:hypothetical protein
MDHECLGCKEGMDSVRAKQAQMIEKHGWCSHIVQDDPQSPTRFNYHTHGFPDHLGIPDVQVVCPVLPEIIHNIVHSLADQVKEGRQIELGRREDRLVRNLDVLFVEATEGERQVWRMILPDQDNRLLRDEIAAPFDLQWADLTVQP